jgi:hypothetical protein
MGMPPGSGTERADLNPAVKAEPAADRLDAVLDIVGLLVLGWMLVLWQLGTPGVPTLPGLPAFPGFAQLSVRGELGLTLVAVTALLAVVVLASFARPPGRLRWLAATPLLVVLLGFATWRFVVGFVMVADQGLTSTFAARNAGFWDGPAVALGFAGAVLLIARPAGLSWATRAVVTAAVTVSVSATLVIAVLSFGKVFSPGVGPDAYVGLIVALPPLIIALVGAAMAPGWLRSMHLGEPTGAAALLLWGLVVAAEQVVPFYLILILGNGRGILSLDAVGGLIAGLDWAEGMLAVASAALIAPVVRDFRTRDRRERRAVLRGPFAVLSLLLIANLVSQLVAYRMITGMGGPSSSVLDRPEPVEQLIIGLGLLGALLIGLVAAWPQPRWAPFTLAGGVLLLAVPLVAFLTPEAFSRDPSAPTRGTVGTVVMPFNLWGGAMFALIFILPVALLALLTTGRRSPEPASASEVFEEDS